MILGRYANFLKASPITSKACQISTHLCDCNILNLLLDVLLGCGLIKNLYVCVCVCV